MRYLLAILLLTGPAYAAAPRNPVKCGRVVAARLATSALSGGGEIRLPKACPLVEVPPPYTVQSTTLGNVLLYPDGTLAATFLVPPQRTAMAPMAAAPRPSRRTTRRDRPLSGYHQETKDLNGRAVSALVED